MKKEYIILIALIIGLGAYLGLKKGDRIHYELPVPPAVDIEQIDRIELTKAQRTITLNKSETGWTLTDQKFPADQTAVDNILDIVKELKLSALVSEAGDLIRYELDPPNAVTLSAFAGEDEKRVFTIGKTAPSFNHTYVMLDGDKRIYQADKSFRNHFDASVQDLRDKLIFEVKADTIKKITLAKDGKSAVFIKSPPDADKKTDDAKASDWQSAEGSSIDKAALDNLLSSLSHLECSEFLTDPAAEALIKDAPSCKITLENGQILNLDLFQQNGKADMVGTTSYTPYIFSLAAYKVDDILSYVDKLLGIEKIEETGSKVK
ncbi:MAG: hypothetical protein CSA29_01120 [Desulfobacterales bacterium]|nr:MAG: hypothetical protein CSA29_01120 [Desulfobacterales bacterium]